MDCLINDAELAALCGLPHLQQLAYFRGIRPYMDVKTGIVGIKRGISLQSIAEQLYIEPHQGIKSVSYSRAQVSRALAALERADLIILQSQELKLILKCNLATLGYSVQNKAVTNPLQQAITAKSHQHTEINNDLTAESLKADIDKTAKAVTPLKEDNYIYLLSQFEQFWVRYPEKKSRNKALLAFQIINPDQMLFNKIMQALDAQIQHYETKQVHGVWVPPWKFPANWLTQQSWEDELKIDNIQDANHAKCRKNTGNSSTKNMFWIPDESEDEQPKSNVIQFQQRK